MATNIVNQQGLPGGPLGATSRAPGQEGPGQLFQALSSTLGISASQIQQQLASGSSLSQIASSQGVSQSTLLSAVESALSSSGPGQNLSSSQLSQMATNIVNQQGLPGGPLGATSQGQTAPSSGSSSPVSTDLILLMLETATQGTNATSTYSSDVSSTDASA
jgi:hypothetical protein